MKKLKVKTITVVVAALLLSLNANVFAQSGMGRGDGRGNNPNQQKGYFCNIPDLTEDQQNQIDKLRTAHIKEMQDFRNQHGEKRAKLQTLQTADNVDMDKINKLIDEMGTIRIGKQKKAAAHRQAVRNLLTDEQKVYFDTKRRGRGAGMGKGYGSGHGQGRGSWGKGNCRR